MKILCLYEGYRSPEKGKKEKRYSSHHSRLPRVGVIVGDQGEHSSPQSILRL
jgi:hypothetical protein